ncbi:MAG: amino acid permease [bacterium]|nr:amino acid permease [bacterium]
MSKENTTGVSRLSRQLSLFDSTMIMVGIVLGSGIFLTTGIMAKSIPSASLILLAWIAGGLFTLAGALTYAELGAAMPEAGGQYVYLREAYGPLSGFLFGWILFIVYMSGGIAALAVAFAEYFGYFFPAFSPGNILFQETVFIFGESLKIAVSAGKLVGVGAILFLSFIILMGTRFGKLIQNIFTVVKVGAVSMIVILGFALGKGAAIDFTFNPGGMSISGLISGFGVALVAVFWAFDGWNNVTLVAGEIKNPGRNLPLSLIWGTLLITILYILVNYIYLYALPISEMTGVVRVAEKATSVLFGGTTSAVVSALILASVFGSLNGSILVGPRVYFAMAKDGLFFKSLAKIHPGFKTPARAIIAQAVWSSILVLSGTFEQLLTYVIFVSIIFWISAASAVFTLRKKFPDMPRPYKTRGYPVVPIIFIVASAGILINTVIEKPFESLAGLGFTLLGIPVFYYWKRKKKT